eukprot:3731835-Amphidinium_carterae.5
MGRPLQSKAQALSSSQYGTDNFTTFAGNSNCNSNMSRSSLKKFSCVRATISCQCHNGHVNVHEERHHEIAEYGMRMQPQPCVAAAVGAGHDSGDEVHDHGWQSGFRAAGRYLLHKYLKYMPMSAAGASLRMTAKSARTRLCAAAESAMRAQTAVVEAVARYCHLMQDHNVQPIAFFEHVSYDATPFELRVRRPGQSRAESTKTKIYAIESDWCALLQTSTGALSRVAVADLPDVQAKHLLVRGGLSLRLRVLEQHDCHAVAQLLASTSILSQELESPFKHLFRVAESDEGAENMKAERILLGGRSALWQKGAFHVICAAHKAHTGSEKTWTYSQAIVSGMIHVSKISYDTAFIKAVHDTMTVEIKKRLLIIYSSAMPAEAQHFREYAFQTFLPPKSAPKQRTLIEQMGKLLNGNWLKIGVLEHRCSAQCCKSAEETEAKMLQVLPAAFMSLRPRMFQRNNWADWHTQMDWFLRACCVHSFMKDVYSLVLQGTPLDTHAAEEEEDQSMAAAASTLGGSAADGTTGASHDPGEDKMKQERKERAKSTRIAKDFMASNFLKEIWILRRCLQPQVEFTQNLLSFDSKEFLTKLLHNQVYAGWKIQQVLALVRPDMYNQLYLDCFDTFRSERLWSFMTTTELLQSTLLRFSTRAASIVHFHIEQRYQVWPWRLFQLLDDPDEAVVHELLASAQSQPCCLDPVSKHLLATYEDNLLCEELKQILSALSHLVKGTTFSTERAHSRNLRRQRQRATLKQMDLSELALTHVAVAGHPLLRQPLTGKSEPKLPQKRGRPSHKEKLHRDAIALEQLTGGGHCAMADPRSDVAADNGALPAVKKRRHGGGGAYRAYCHLHHTGKFTKESLQSLSTAYRALSIEEKSHYENIGKLGTPGSQRWHHWIYKANQLITPAHFFLGSLS